MEAALAVRRGRQRGGARDREEADLAGAAGGTASQRAVEDHRRARPVAEPQQDEGVPVPGHPVTLLCQRRQVGLVLHAHPGLGQPLLEGGDEPAVPLGQPGGVAEFAAGRVDQAGRPDPDGVQPVGAGLLDHALDQRDRLLHGGARPHVTADRHRLLGQHPSHQVRDGHGDALGAYVQRGEVRPVRDDAVHLGVGPAPLLPRLADHRDQPGCGEAFDEVGDGRPGQTGQLLQLPCRQRALLLEQTQGEPVVDGPGGARGCGHAGILPDLWGRTAGCSGRPVIPLSIRQGS
ncbi:hypothetical protein SAFG77S_03720 [Streptomyces afghaniensis]